MWTSAKEAWDASARLAGEASEKSAGPPPPIVIPDKEATTYGGTSPAINFQWYDGDKFAGGFGATQVLTLDYWTLRQRSAQLFRTNAYARGIVKRLVTNVINTGLHLEATPEEVVLGFAEDDLADWTEDIENRFELWASDPESCDRSCMLSFGKLQQAAYEEALISGDVLVVLDQNKRTKLPTLRLISGAAVQTPINPKTTNSIQHGVEVDKFGKHVAYWVLQEDGTSKRLPARGEKTGRRLAWLVYGGNRRIGETRGEPLLAIALQALREIDRYRDATVRKALLGALWLAIIEKEADKAGSRFFSRGAAGKQTLTQADGSGQVNSTVAVNQIPGMVAQELQVGEKVKFNDSTSTNEKFSDFESAILYGIAWAFEIPPEILTLSFNANYSASQAAINEFKMFLDRVRYDFGTAFCAPVYEDWFLSELLNLNISAAGYLEAYRDGAKRQVLTAWHSSDWAGHIKPSTDIMKQAKGLIMALDRGLTHYDRASREFSGLKFSKNVKRQKKQIAALKDAGLMIEPEPPENVSSGGAGGEGSSTDQSNASTRRILAALADLQDSIDAMQEGTH